MELRFTPYYYTLICAFLLSVLLTSLSIKPAQQLGWVDRPSDRKHHRHAAPLTGGITMCIAFCLSWLLLPGKPHAYTMLLTGMVLLTLIGVYDDLHSSRPVTRLLFQVGVVVLMAFQGEIILRDLGNLFGLGIVELGWTAILFTIFSIVGVINAFNMIDGLDGLAGGLALIAAGWLIALNLAAPVPDPHASHILLTLMMVIAGFLCFNLRHPWRTYACVFMGDAGSTMIGFALGWFMVDLSQNSENRAAIMSPMTAIWILALPLLDTITIMVRRIRTGQSPFAADRQHLHHLLLRYGLPDGQVTLILLFIAALTGAVGVIAYWLDVPDYFQFYAFLAVSLLYYYKTYRLWARQRSMHVTDKDPLLKPLHSAPVLPLHDIPVISRFESGRQIDVRPPAEVGEAGNVEQFLRGPVGLSRVERNFAGITDDARNLFGQFADRDVRANPDIDQGSGVGVQPDVDAGGGHVIDMQEFAPGGTGAPEQDAGRGGRMGGNPQTLLEISGD